MKQILFYALATSLLLGFGCKKKEDGTTELMSADEVAVKAAEVTEKAEEVTQKATAAVSSFSVKAEDVMADLNQSVQEVQNKVSNFDKAQAMAYVSEYKTVILGKKDQVTALTEKLKGLSIAEITGETGKTLKAELSKHTDQFVALKKRYLVYYEKLEEYGVNMSKFQL
jgi:ABC-type Fe3+-hydroxamate transport system substrate-binding protein